MRFQFKDRLTLSAASTMHCEGTVLGFECEPTVSLGVRGSAADLVWSEAQWLGYGYLIERADRGGQATIHNPGQLVIFPGLDVRPYGARRFVDHLLTTTQVLLLRRGVEAACRSGQPGLYTKKGKIVSLGLRIKNGIVHHGLAINVRNDLAPFQGIRVCGVDAAPVDRLGGEEPLSELFSSWCEEFRAQLTSRKISPNLGLERSDVRS